MRRWLVMFWFCWVACSLAWAGQELDGIWTWQAGFRDQDSSWGWSGTFTLRTNANGKTYGVFSDGTRIENVVTRASTLSFDRVLKDVDLRLQSQIQAWSGEVVTNAQGKREWTGNFSGAFDDGPAKQGRTRKIRATQ